MSIINYLDNKQSLFKYTIDLHNQVNKSLGKKIYTYDEVVQIYKEHYNPDEVKSETINQSEKNKSSDLNQNKKD